MVFDFEIEKEFSEWKQRILYVQKQIEDRRKKFQVRAESVNELVEKEESDSQNKMLVSFNFTRFSLKLEGELTYLFQSKNLVVQM